MIKKSCGSTTCAQNNPQPINSFYSNKARHDNVDDYCKVCRKAYAVGQYKVHKDKILDRSKKWYRNNPHLAKRNKWRSRGIDPDIAECMLASIKACQICGSLDKLVPDHCHTTELIRGVLCQNCNLGIGKLGDNYKMVKRASDYLQKAEYKGNIV